MVREQTMLQQMTQRRKKETMLMGRRRWRQGRRRRQGGSKKEKNEEEEESVKGSLVTDQWSEKYKVLSGHSIKLEFCFGWVIGLQLDHSCLPCFKQPLYSNNLTIKHCFR